MDKIVEIQRAPKLFAAAEASFVTPLLRSITSRYASRVDPLLSQLDMMTEKQSEEATQKETEANRLIREWHQKVKKLGGEPRGLWVVDLQGNEGKYRWRNANPEGLFWIKEGAKTGTKISLVEGPDSIN